MPDEKQIKEKLECLKNYVYHELNHLKEEMHPKPQTIHAQSDNGSPSANKDQKLQKHKKSVRRLGRFRFNLYIPNAGKSS